MQCTEVVSAQRVGSLIQPGSMAINLRQEGLNFKLITLDSQIMSIVNNASD